jgi:hypothetical protein
MILGSARYLPIDKLACSLTCKKPDKFDDAPIGSRVDRTCCAVRRRRSEQVLSLPGALLSPCHLKAANSSRPELRSQKDGGKRQ